MTYDDRLWVQRQQELFGPLYMRWIDPVGKGRSRWRFRVYLALLQAHRWCWVRGFGL